MQTQRLGGGDLGVDCAVGVRSAVHEGRQRYGVLCRPPRTGKVDILFMVDNSSSMQPSQANLLAELPGVHERARGPAGGPAERSRRGGLVGHGRGRRLDRRLQRRPAATTASSSTRRAAPARRPTLQPGRDLHLERRRRDQLHRRRHARTCSPASRPLGASGCGFEHQLASITRALGVDGQGPRRRRTRGSCARTPFWRSSCSPTRTTARRRRGARFDTTSNQNLESAVGPPSNFRCNEFGHLCGSPPAQPPRLSPNPTDLSTTVTLDDCTSAECDGMLMPVAEFAARIKSLKADPASQILVVAITGPATPYTVHWSSPPTNDTGPWPSMVHACTTTSGDFADPAVRLTQWARAFGSNGIVSSICDASFAATMQQLAQGIGDAVARAPSADGGIGGPGPLSSCVTVADGGTGGRGGGGAGGGDSGSAGSSGMSGPGGADASVTGAGNATGRDAGAARDAGEIQAERRLRLRDRRRHRRRRGRRVARARRSGWTASSQGSMRSAPDGLAGAAAVGGIDLAARGLRRRAARRRRRGSRGRSARTGRSTSCSWSTTRRGCRTRRRISPRTCRCS